MEDIKSKQAFILWGVGQSFIDTCELSAEYLLKYTSYDVVIYYGNGKTSSLTSPRLQKIDLSTFDFYKENFIDGKPKFAFTPYITKLALELYDEVAYIDSDIQVTPNIKDIFNEHSKITIYPLACRYPWYYTLDRGRDWIGDKVKQNIPYERQLTPTLGISCHIANKNCLSFIDEWVTLTKKLVTDNTQGVHEEAIFNALVWQKGGNKFISTKLAWVPQPEAILEVIDIYNSPEGKPLHPDGTNPSYILTKNTWGGGMSCFPLDKNEFWGLHTIKEINKAKQAYLYIEEYFNKL